jgi:hypothetical protein
MKMSPGVICGSVERKKLTITFVPGPVPWFCTVFTIIILSPGFAVVGPEREETTRSGTGVVTPVPTKGRFVGLFWFVPLWVIVSVSLNTPVVPGENRTTIVVEAPGERLNTPPPLTNEKGAEGPPTLPVRVPVELD